MEPYRCIERIARTLPLRSRHSVRVIAGRQPLHPSTKPLQSRSFTSSITYQADEGAARPRGTTARGASDALSSLLANSVIPQSTAGREAFLRRSRTPSPSSSQDTMPDYLKPLDRSRDGNDADATPSLDVQGALDPQGLTRGSKPPPPLVLQEAPFKCGPLIGRTIHIDPARGRDIGMGFRLLNSLQSRNKIAKEFRAQRFHELGGLRRKRLKSERYRARFFKAFQETVARVQTMRKMGW